MGDSINKAGDDLDVVEEMVVMIERKRGEENL
jgi:hypothetical protein